MKSGENSSSMLSKDIMVGEVVYTGFQEQITVNGTILPMKTVLIDALVGGKVVERFVENGANVLKNQAIVRLENSDLELDILNKETQVFDLINNIQHTRNALEQNKVSRLSELADIEFQYQESQRLFQVNETLYAEKVISESEWKQSTNTYQYYKRKKELISRAAQKDSLSAVSQIRQMEVSLEQARKNLDLMRRKMDDLIIKAPVDGKLSAFSLEEGQLIASGSNVGQVDVLNGFKVNVQIDEHFNSRVHECQLAQMILDGNDIPMQVYRIYPTIENSFFSADLHFAKDAPLGVRRGQNIRVKIEMGASDSTTVLQKGSFFQSTGGQWVYVLSADGKSAVKRSVQLGRQNPGYYEVIEGLDRGERVIISSYQNFKDFDIIHLN
jgi:HlyD family secretion protein